MNVFISEICENRNIKNAVKLESMEKSLRLSKIFFFFKFLKLLSRDMKNYTLHYMQFKNSSLFWQLGKYRMKN